MLIRGVVKCSARNCLGVTGKLTSPVCSTSRANIAKGIWHPPWYPLGNFGIHTPWHPLREFGIHKQQTRASVQRRVVRLSYVVQSRASNSKHVRLSAVELYVYLTLCSVITRREIGNTDHLLLLPPEKIWNHKPLERAQMLHTRISSKVISPTSYESTKNSTRYLSANSYTVGCCKAEKAVIRKRDQEVRTSRWSASLQR